MPFRNHFPNFYFQFAQQLFTLSIFFRWTRAIVGEEPEYNNIVTQAQIFITRIISFYVCKTRSSYI